MDSTSIYLCCRFPSFLFTFFLSISKAYPLKDSCYTQYITDFTELTRYDLFQRLLAKGQTDIFETLLLRNILATIYHLLSKKKLHFISHYDKT